MQPHGQTMSGMIQTFGPLLESETVSINFCFSDVCLISIQVAPVVRRISFREIRQHHRIPLR